MLPRFAFDIADFVSDARPNRIDKAWFGMLHVAHFFARGALLQFLDHADNLDDRLVGKFNRVGDVIFFRLAAAKLDHVDIMLRAGDDEIKITVFDLLDGGIKHQFAVDAADAHMRDRRQERNIRDRDGG